MVEILLSTISSRTLLAGKVIGNTILAMGQILVLAAIAVVGLGLVGLYGATGTVVTGALLFIYSQFVVRREVVEPGPAQVHRDQLAHRHPAE